MTAISPNSAAKHPRSRIDTGVTMPEGHTALRRLAEAEKTSEERLEVDFTRWLQDIYDRECRSSQPAGAYT